MMMMMMMMMITQTLPTSPQGVPTVPLQLSKAAYLSFRNLRRHHVVCSSQPLANCCHKMALKYSFSGIFNSSQRRAVDSIQPTYYCAVGTSNALVKKANDKQA